jgi:hypothetical protein
MVRVSRRNSDLGVICSHLYFPRDLMVAGAPVRHVWMHMSRSQKHIDRRDLSRLASLAAADRMDFIARMGRKTLQHAYRCSALCQGAALHYIDGRNGVKDFDVWSFYAGSSRLFPSRRVVSVDFGNSKFGTSSDRPDFIGRRVDLLGRGIRFEDSDRDDGIIDALRTYLSRGSTASARRLAEKAVVLVDPPRLRGKVVWPISVREMVETLAACGIKRRRGITINDIVQTNYGEPLAPDETTDYLDLLGRLGFERATPPHDELSDQICYLDAECIYARDAYTRILHRMVKMTRGLFPVRRIESEVDFERDAGEVRFRLDAKAYRWPIRVYRDRWRPRGPLCAAIR